MSHLHLFKDQVRKTKFPYGKLLLVLLSNKKYHAYSHVPEYIYDVNRPYRGDSYGNGVGIDYHGNKGK